MAEPLHSSNDFQPSLQLDQTHSEAQNLLEEQQSSKLSTNSFPSHAFASSESAVPGQADTLFGIVEESEPYSVVPEAILEVTQVVKEMHSRCSTKCSFGMDQLIDEISLVEEEEKDADGCKGSRKEKRQRRRKRKAAKIEFPLPNSFEEVERREKKGLVYSREDMLALRFVDVEGQKKKWVEVYSGFDALVVREYDGLARYDESEELVVDFDPRAQLLKAASLGMIDGCNGNGNRLKVCVY